MEEFTLLCKQCRNVFKIPGGNISNKAQCPDCGSPDIIEAPAWAPLGSGRNIFESSTWEYKCQHCGHQFKMPIPKSPTEEKQRRCPSCGAEHIHRLTAIGGEPLYCS